MAVHGASSALLNAAPSGRLVHRSLYSDSWQRRREEKSDHRARDPQCLEHADTLANKPYVY